MAIHFPTNYAEWVQVFMDEGRAYVARLQENGEYVPSPEITARTYARFAAMDATTKGGDHRFTNLARARECADRRTATKADVLRAAA